MSAAATNRVSLLAQSQPLRRTGITTNDSIPVGRMEPWRLEAIQKVIEFGGLVPNWDGQGSEAVARAVRQTAINLLLRVPGESLPMPRIVPVSGGGLHFEWSAGNRELEVSVEPDCKIEALRVENGMPLEDDAPNDLHTLFGWLASRK